jgi:hypothetical protein
MEISELAVAHDGFYQHQQTKNSERIDCFLVSNVKIANERNKEV